LQTITQGRQVLAWEQIDLPGQVYRIRNVRLLDALPDLAGWVDCSANAQWSAEVDDCLAFLGLSRVGTWVGVGLTVAGVCYGLAWQDV
jgi:hypothetical protein